MKLLIAALLAMQANAPQEDPMVRTCFRDDGAMHVTIQNYYDCIQLNSIRLEPSGAEPEHIAVAGKNACRESYVQADSNLNVCGAVFADVLGPTFADRTRRVIEDGAREVAITTVVEIRASAANANGSGRAPS